jgi:LEA14-like dessication related protein
MYDKEELCKKIQSVFPDIGQCGIDVKVEYDEIQKVWAVHLKKGNNTVKHYIEEKDAALCMDGKQCVSLAVEIAQLKDMAERYPGI